jgi:hypothetical protein
MQKYHEIREKEITIDFNNARIQEISVFFIM